MLNDDRNTEEKGSICGWMVAFGPSSLRMLEGKGLMIGRINRLWRNMEYGIEFAKVMPNLKRNDRIDRTLTMAVHANIPLPKLLPRFYLATRQANPMKPLSCISSTLSLSV